MRQLADEFDAKFAALVKACDNPTITEYFNHDDAGTPENYKLYVVPGATGIGSGKDAYTGVHSSSYKLVPPLGCETSA